MKHISKHLESSTHRFVKWTGTSSALVCALAVILLFSIYGICQRDRAWIAQLNTITSLLTFIFIFLVQRSQNKEFQAIQIKLNELISCSEPASNELINIEGSTEEHLRDIQKQHELKK